MEILLNRFKDHHPAPTDLLALLVAELRPENPDQLEDAERRLRALCHLLETRSDLRRAVREAILGLRNHRIRQFGRKIGQQIAQADARRRLIIDDHHRQRRKSIHGSTLRQGKTICTWY